MGNTLTFGLLITYVILALVFAFEGHYAKALYWTGACIINTSVMMME